MKKTLLTLSLLAAAAASQAAAPTASAMSSGLGFAQYTGATAVGNGDLGSNATLYYIDEARTATEKAWTIFFDPAANRSISATITFDQAIKAVQTTSSAYDAGTVKYGVDIDKDGAWNDYNVRVTAGLEADDTLSWAAGARTLTLQWNTNRFGDHIRVITAVPEPSTYAMLLLGFGLIGFAGLRRKRRD